MSFIVSGSYRFDLKDLGTRALDASHGSKSLTKLMTCQDHNGASSFRVKIYKAYVLKLRE